MQKKFFTAEEVAKLLKFNVLTVYSFIRKGELRASKFGRSYRIAEEDLSQFIKDHQVSEY